MVYIVGQKLLNRSLSNKVKIITAIVVVISGFALMRMGQILTSNQVNPSNNSVSQDTPSSPSSLPSTSVANFSAASEANNGKNLTVGGVLYRDFKLNDCFNLTSCKINRSDDTLQGWEVRLYKVDPDSSWELRDSTITNSEGVFVFNRQKTAGKYLVCEVLEDGWTQAKQTWNGSGYKVDTPNGSNASDEAPWCTETVFNASANKSYTTQIGNVDIQAPVGIAEYFGGELRGGIRYIQSINDLSFTETITDNHSVVRSTMLVKKRNTVTGLYEGFCGNWNPLSLGSKVLGGGLTEVNTSGVAVCRSNDTGPWPDGQYQIYHGAYDATGNEGKYNTDRQLFVIDSSIQSN